MMMVARTTLIGQLKIGLLFVVVYESGKLIIVVSS